MRACTQTRILDSLLDRTAPILAAIVAALLALLFVPRLDSALRPAREPEIRGVERMLGTQAFELESGAGCGARRGGGVEMHYRCREMRGGYAFAFEVCPGRAKSIGPNPDTDLLYEVTVESVIPASTSGRGISVHGGADHGGLLTCLT